MFPIENYHYASSVKDAVQALAADANAKIIAGGTDVLVRLHEGDSDYGRLVDINGLSELKEIKIDDEGNILPASKTGNIAIKKGDPVMFLEYWRNPEATRKKYIGDWCLTGDMGKKDERGYLWFVGREDDLITSAGYRIGPGEIEDCLIKHPAVAMAAVVGIPDEVRTEIVKAFIVLARDVTGDLNMEKNIKDFVRVRLAAHEYPREIEFVDDLPTTATGKIIRKDLRQRG